MITAGRRAYNGDVCNYDPHWLEHNNFVYSFLCEKKQYLLCEYFVICIGYRSGNVNVSCLNVT